MFPNGAILTREAAIRAIYDSQSVQIIQNLLETTKICSRMVWGHRNGGPINHSGEGDNMPREHPDYRDNLELLNELFPGIAMLNLDQVRDATGWKDYRTIRKYLPVVGERVSKIAVAKMMCGNGGKHDGKAPK